MKVSAALAMGKLAFIMAGVILVCACVPQSDYEALSSENEELKIRIEELETELEEITAAPDRLLAVAVASFENGDFEQAIEDAEYLLELRPESAEADDAQALIAQAHDAIAEQQRLAEEERLRQQRAREARIDTAQASLHSERDEVRSITWYYDRTIYNQTGSTVSVYMGEQGLDRWLRFKIFHSYSSDRSWLFVDRFTFNIDGTLYTITPEYDEIKRDNAYSRMWEWYDASATDHLDIVNAIMDSDRVILRLSGDTRVDDRDLTAAERQGIINVVTAFLETGARVSGLADPR
jgi:tetratricopeptide (TPR) repeat protein